MTWLRGFSANKSGGVLRQGAAGRQDLHGIDRKQALQQTFKVGGPDGAPAFSVLDVGIVREPCGDDVQASGQPMLFIDLRDAGK